MKEKILRFERGPPGKKYTAYIQDRKQKNYANFILEHQIMNNLKTVLH